MNPRLGEGYFWAGGRREGGIGKCSPGDSTSKCHQVLLTHFQLKNGVFLIYSEPGFGSGEGSEENKLRFFPPISKPNARPELQACHSIPGHPNPGPIRQLSTLQRAPSEERHKGFPHSQFKEKRRSFCCSICICLCICCCCCCSCWIRHPGRPGMRVRRFSLTSLGL